jgi:hypothetical protein
MAVLEVTGREAADPIAAIELCYSQGWTAILDAQYGFSNIVRHRKPSASKPVAPEVIEEWQKLCDLAIVGVGD